MTRYDTSAQARLRQSSRRLNLVFAGVLFAIGTWLIASYITLYLSLFPPTTTFELLLGVLVYCFASIPLSQALIRRPHPETVDVREEGIILRFRKGGPIRIAWEDRPVSMAYDERGVKGSLPRHPRIEGMEVQVYLPRPGREPGTETFRPMELDLSGEAFDEIEREMKRAGFRPRRRTWSRRRPGEMVEFLRPGDPGADETPEELPSSRLSPRSRSRRPTPARDARKRLRD